MTDRKAMQQALDALEIEQGAHAYLQLGKAEHIEEAITALRDRLAQPEQEPVKFNCTVVDDDHPNGVPLSQWGKHAQMQPCAGRNCGSTNPNLHSAECFEDYEKATGMAQPEQEPVIGKWSLREVYFDEDGEPISHRSPPQRKPLTDEEIEREWQFLHDEEGNPPDHHDFARAIEAAHGIKENT